MCLALHVTIQLLNLSMKTANRTQHNTGGKKRSSTLWAASLATALLRTKHYNCLETQAEIFTTTSNCSPPNRESHGCGRVSICAHLLHILCVSTLANVLQWKYA